MAREINRLHTRQVPNLTAPGLHADGGGLYLRVNPGKNDKPGSRQWVLIYNFKGKRREMGLGGLSKEFGLVEARREASAQRRLLVEGKDPIAEKEAKAKAEAEARAAAEAEAKLQDTFEAVSDALVGALEPGWKSAKHKQQWRASMTNHCTALLPMRVGDITAEDVRLCLEPIWTAKPGISHKVRGRIERILDAARVRGLIHGPWENPARFRGNLAHVLAPRRQLIAGHHAAMPYADVSAFLVALRKVPGIGARALELTVLLALRTGETINARWSEIDLEAGLWVVPGERMKGGREHRVPLVGRALELLTEEHEARCGSDLVFPGRKPGKPISNMSMEMVMRRMGYGDRVNSKGEMLKGDKPDYTVHGMRSTFADWARDLTDHPEEVIEAALAHVFGSAVRRAYRRGDAMDKRRALMTDWDRWCLGAPAAANDEPAEISPDERAGGEASAAM